MTESRWQLPPGKKHQWRVFLDEDEDVIAEEEPSAYLARESASRRLGVSPSRIRVEWVRKAPEE